LDRKFAVLKPRDDGRKVMYLSTVEAARSSAAMPPDDDAALIMGVPFSG
jgi:hypothetical protein